MRRDAAFYDFELECLECGEFHFKESRLHGVCEACYKEVYETYDNIHDVQQEFASEPEISIWY